MSFEIIVSEGFQRRLKKLGKRYSSIRGDFSALLDQLELNPTAGTPLGRDCYKVRMAIAAKNKGKSGGARVITCVKVVGQRVYLLTIYDKSAQDSVSDSERDELLRDNGLL